MVMYERVWSCTVAIFTEGSPASGDVAEAVPNDFFLFLVVHFLVRRAELSS